jgi:N-formylglutamate amidohydrolase
MPKAVEQALAKEAKKKGFSKERTDRYIYGYINKHYKKVNGKWVKR